MGLVSALDHASTGIKLSKNGGALTIRHASVTASTYDSYGSYLCTLDTTDTNTLGTLRMQFIETATCLPVWVDCMVMPANVWDSLYGADVLQVDQLQWLGTQVAAVDTNGYPKVTVKDGTGQGEILTTSGKVDGVILSDTVTTYTGNTVQTGDSFARIGATGSGLSTLATQASVNTIDDFLDTEIAAIKTVTDAIGATGTGLSAIPWNAAWDAEVQSEAADALNAYDPPTHTELTAELATADDATLAAIAALNNVSQANIRTAVGLGSANLDTQLSTIDDFLDTEVAAIKAKTDSLTFTVAGQVDANVQRINDVPITGDGSGTPFGV